MSEVCRATSLPSFLLARSVSRSWEYVALSIHLASNGRTHATAAGESIGKHEPVKLAIVEGKAQVCGQQGERHRERQDALHTHTRFPGGAQTEPDAREERNRPDEPDFGEHPEHEVMRIPVGFVQASPEFEAMAHGSPSEHGPLREHLPRRRVDLFPMRHPAPTSHTQCLLPAHPGRLRLIRNYGKERDGQKCQKGVPQLDAQASTTKEKGEEACRKRQGAAARARQDY